jgi:hypothetical protein
MRKFEYRSDPYRITNRIYVEHIYKHYEFSCCFQVVSCSYLQPFKKYIKFLSQNLFKRAPCFINACVTRWLSIACKITKRLLIWDVYLKRIGEIGHCLLQVTVPDLIDMTEKSHDNLSIFWDLTPHTLVIVNWRFGGTYCLHLLGPRASLARKQYEARV